MAGSDAYNPAFDVTPPRLVTAVVTERGVAHPVNAGNLRVLRTGSGAVDDAHRSGHDVLSVTAMER
jgi:hypothetical protein